MSNRVLCKFFLHGACLKGGNCEFSHDWKDSENNVCTYYQKGACSYGSRCRYDHVRISRPYLSDTSSSTKPDHSLSSNSVSVTSTKSSSTPTDPAWNLVVRDYESSESDSVNNSCSLSPSEKPICSFAAAGNCPRGQKCPHIHGDECPTCGKQCLHPFRADEREEHLRICLKRQKHLIALKNSQEIECSVCLERVLLKPTPAERKFGLLSECSHPFCISCIRNWRGSSPATGMDVNSALRACPICRKLSYYVIPSVIWYGSEEEKQEIVESYKAKLSSINCRYFDFGNGTCPFGSSCFYKHAYPDGRLAEASLRYLGDENGDVVIAKNIRISDFLGNLHIG